MPIEFLGRLSTPAGVSASDTLGQARWDEIEARVSDGAGRDGSCRPFCSASDGTRVAGGQDYEVRYESKKTGKSKGAVKRAVKKVGSSRKKVERALSR